MQTGHKMNLQKPENKMSAMDYTRRQFLKTLGAGIVDHRESPLFMRMAKPDDYFRSITEKPFEDINYNYSEVVGVTGATRSADAIVAGIRDAIAAAVRENFGVEIPAEEKKFN